MDTHFNININNVSISWLIGLNIFISIFYNMYIYICGGCGEEYIGETGNLLRQRVTIHNQQIRDPKTRMLKVSEHIANCAHNLNPKYKIFPFYKMYSESTTLRRAKEKFFINTLKPKLNRLH